MEKKREKKLLTNTFILSLGTFLPNLTVLVTLPIYTGMLTKSEYGNYDLVNVFEYILSIVITLQIAQAVFRFLIDVRGTEKEKIYITNTILFELIPTVLASIIFGVSFTDKPILTQFLLGLYIFLNIQYNVTGQITRGQGKTHIYAIGAIVRSIIHLILVIIFMSKLKLGFDGLFISLNFSLIVGIIIYILSCKLWNYVDFSLFSIDVVHELISYSWPMVPNTLSIWIINTCDKFIIRAILGLEYNGIFAAAQKIPNIFSMAYNTFNMAWQESASITEKDKDYNQYYNNIFYALLNFLTGCMTVLISFSPILFKILIRGSYELAYDQMPLLYIGAYFSSISSFFGSIYIAKKATKNVGISSAIGAVINIIVNMMLIHGAGLYAASISTIISYLSLVLYRTWDVEKRGFVHIIYRKRYIIICLTLIILSSILLYMKNSILNWVNITFGIIVFVVLNRLLIHQVFLAVFHKIRK